MAASVWSTDSLKAYCNIVTDAADFHFDATFLYRPTFQK